MRKSRLKSYFLWVLPMAVHLCVLADYEATDQAINGYWQITSLDRQLVGVIHLHVDSNHLIGNGIRVNVINPKQRLEWICTYGDPSLRGHAVWGGGVFLDMQRDDQDKSFFYDGIMRSAVGCKVLKPKVIFTSARTAKLKIPEQIDYMDYDKQLAVVTTFDLTKVSRSQALQGCQHVITEKDKRRWGDLVISAQARKAMLKDMKLTKKSWLKLANDYKICFDY